MSSATLMAAIGGKALWFLTRSSGLVSLALLSATIVLGVVASVGWTTQRWPRFLSQNVHRNISLLCIVFVGVHVVTTVADGYVPIGFLDAILPFHSPYRPLYVGLGALGFDLLVAVLITSGLRHRIGFASWRFVHWLAYLCWPIALVHALGTGSDTSLPVVIVTEALCAAAVLGAVAWRILAGRQFPAARRLGAGAAAVVITVVIAGFALLGPLQPGWSHRSGTSSALLAQLAAKNGSPSATPAPAPVAPSPATTTPAATTSVPSAPFRYAATGTQSQRSLGDEGSVRVVLAMHLQDPGSTPLVITLTGTSAEGGGVSLSSGAVAFGSYQGTVTSLEGNVIQASVATPSPMILVTSLQLSQTSAAFTASVSGTSAAGR
jgi:DMSO/TMAO reductase YedYZ heme-binding membrane subunit